jgi:hypothetical protein
VNASFAAGTDVARQYTILHAADGVTGTFGAEVNTNLPTNFHTALSYDGNNAYLNLILNFAVPSGKKLIESRSGTRVNFLHRQFTDFGDMPGTQLFSCCRCKLGDRNPLGSPTKAAGRYSHPRSPNAERSTPGGAYHPPVR